MTALDSKSIAEPVPSKRPANWFWLWTAVYAVLLMGVIWTMFSTRRWALSELANPKAIGQWEEWREDVRQQQVQSSPVQRRVPKSAEPPTLVLLRDYFVVSLVGAVLFSSLLYFVIAWFVTGILNTPVTIGEQNDSQKRLGR